MKRIWCEFLTPDQLMQPWIVKALVEYNVALNYKVEYGQVNDKLFKLLNYYNEQGIPVSLWMTLRDEDGYWINEQNCEQFYEYVEISLQKLEQKDIKIRGLCIDLEPPLAFTRKILSPKFFHERFIAALQMLFMHSNPVRYRKSVRVFSKLAILLKQKGIESMAVGPWLLYYDLKYKTKFMQNILETPLFEVPWDSYNLMYYTTIIKQYFPKMHIKQLEAFVYTQIKFLRENIGTKFSVSVGCTGLGKLGHEAFYNHPFEFKKDIELCKSCGVEDFSLFSLDGLMEEKKLKNFLTHL